MTSTYTCYSRRVQDVLPQEVRAGVGAYFFSAGDISTFIEATGIAEAVFVDRYPFLAEEGWSHDLPGYLHGAREYKWKPREINDDLLKEIYEDKCKSGYTNNYYSAIYKETGIFALMELIDLGAKKVEIFRADNGKGYLVTFDLGAQSFRIIFRRQFISEHTFPAFLTEHPARLFFFKSGNSLEYEEVKDERLRRRGYFGSDDFLRRAAGEFPQGSFVVSYDHQPKPLTFEPIPFVLPGFSFRNEVRVGVFTSDVAHIYQSGEPITPLL